MIYVDHLLLEILRLYLLNIINQGHLHESVLFRLHQIFLWLYDKITRMNGQNTHPILIQTIIVVGRLLLSVHQFVGMEIKMLEKNVILLYTLLVALILSGDLVDIQALIINVQIELARQFVEMEN